MSDDEIELVANIDSDHPRNSQMQLTEVVGPVDTPIDGKVLYDIMYRNSIAVMSRVIPVLNLSIGCFLCTLMCLLQLGTATWLLAAVTMDKTRLFLLVTGQLGLSGLFAVFILGCMDTHSSAKLKFERSHRPSSGLRSAILAHVTADRSLVLVHTVFTNALSALATLLWLKKIDASQHTFVLSRGTPIDREDLVMFIDVLTLPNTFAMSLVVVSLAILSAVVVCKWLWFPFAIKKDQPEFNMQTM